MHSETVTQKTAPVNLGATLFLLRPPRGAPEPDRSAAAPAGLREEEKERRVPELPGGVEAGLVVDVVEEEEVVGRRTEAELRFPPGRRLYSWSLND